MRKAAARTTEALYAAIADGLQTLTAQNAQSWFAHCGYKGLLNERRSKRPQRLLELDPILPWANHIWMGVSVESAAYRGRIDLLRRTHAHVKFLSVEPLLGRIEDMNLAGIDWVIVGGESGPGARPVQEAWVTEIRDQCLAANVKFFFKQWGGVRKHRTGRVLEGKTWDELPQWVESPLLLT